MVGEPAAAASTPPTTVKAKLYFALESGPITDLLGFVPFLAGEKLSLQLFSADVPDADAAPLPAMTAPIRMGSRTALDGSRPGTDKGLEAIWRASRGKNYVAEVDMAVPAGYGTLGGALVRLEGKGLLGMRLEVYMVALTLQVEGEQEVVLPADTYIEPEQGARALFFGTSLPADTPAPLAELRRRELEILRGERRQLLSDEAPRLITEQPRSYDRFYQYDVYNDLGRAYKKPSDKKPDAAESRPTLGGAGSEYPYPRRCRTGRELNPDGTESSASSFWVPKDQSFNNARTRGFFGLLITEVPAFARQAVAGLLGKSTWASFDQLINQLYQPSSDGGSVNDLDDIWDQLSKLDRIPLVIKDRECAWRSDAEFGRQVLAGVNPMAVKAARPEFLEGSALGDATVPAELTGGKPISELLAQAKAGGYASPSLFLIDHHALFIDFAKQLNADPEQGSIMYGARCLLHRAEGSDQLLPVAIELEDPSDGQGARVFTPRDPQGVWLLAKAVFGANDSGAHQLVSHFLRTHAACEPFIMSLHRHLAAAHPIHKLLMPHTRATMQINSMARSSLISAGGIIERTFSPGPYSMALSSKVYGAAWRFDEQALPADLLARGMATLDASSGEGLRLGVPDYPFAADGLLVYRAFERYAAEYVELYYKDDAAIGDDAELQAFWNDIRLGGHPDIAQGWPELVDAKALVNVITTIMWLTSAHHATVNFNQYDTTGFMPNKPSQIRKPGMPREGSADWECLAAGGEDGLQEVFLKTVASPTASTLVAYVVETLSTHFTDEVYIDSVRQPYLTDPRGAEAYERLRASLQEVAASINARNADTSLANRGPGPNMGDGTGPLPYNMLLPNSVPGITSRGVPTSISI